MGGVGVLTSETPHQPQSAAARDQRRLQDRSVAVEFHVRGVQQILTAGNERQLRAQGPLDPCVEAREGRDADRPRLIRCGSSEGRPARAPSAAWRHASATDTRACGRRSPVPPDRGCRSGVVSDGRSRGRCRSASRHRTALGLTLPRPACRPAGGSRVERAASSRVCPFRISMTGGCGSKVCRSS